MAGKKEEVFILAQSHGEMETNAACLKDFSVEERLRITQYFEGKSEWLLAADHYEKSNNQAKAFQLYFKAGQDNIT